MSSQAKAPGYSFGDRAANAKNYAIQKASNPAALANSAAANLAWAAQNPLAAFDASTEAVFGTPIALLKGELQLWWNDGVIPQAPGTPIARITDPIMGHQKWARRAGYATGVLLGVAAGLLTKSPAVAISVASVSSDLLENLFPYIADEWLGMGDGGGPIEGVCATATFAEGLKVARAGIDIGQCNECSPPKIIATGSETVFVEGKCVARVKDVLVCEAPIKMGAPTVIVGGGTAQVAQIEAFDAIPKAIRRVMMIASFAVPGALAVGAIKQAAAKSLLKGAMTGVVHAAKFVAEEAIADPLVEEAAMAAASQFTDDDRLVNAAGSAAGLREAGRDAGRAYSGRPGTAGPSGTTSAPGVTAGTPSAANANANSNTNANASSAQTAADTRAATQARVRANVEASAAARNASKIDGLYAAETELRANSSRAAGPAVQYGGGPLDGVQDTGGANSYADVDVRSRVLANLEASRAAREASRMQNLTAAESDWRQARALEQRMPKGRQYQAVNNLNDLYLVSMANKPSYDAKITDIAARTGGTPALAPLKGQSRVLEKIAFENNDPLKGLFGEVNEITDILRGSIVYDSEAELREGLRAVDQEMKIVSIKDRFQDPTMNYRDVLVLVDTGGGNLAELQLHLRDVIVAKEGADWKGGLGHELYAKIRDPNTSAEERARLTAESKRLYGEKFGDARQRGYTGDQATDAERRALESEIRDMRDANGGELTAEQKKALRDRVMARGQYAVSGLEAADMPTPNGAPPVTGNSETSNAKIPDDWNAPDAKAEADTATDTSQTKQGDGKPQSAADVAAQAAAREKFEAYADSRLNPDRAKILKDVIAARVANPNMTAEQLYAQVDASHMLNRVEDMIPYLERRLQQEGYLLLPEVKLFPGFSPDAPIPTDASGNPLVRDGYDLDYRQMYGSEMAAAKEARLNGEVWSPEVRTRVEQTLTAARQLVTDGKMDLRQYQDLANAYAQSFVSYGEGDQLYDGELQKLRDGAAHRPLLFDTQLSADPNASAEAIEQLILDEFVVGLGTSELISPAAAQMADSALRSIDQFASHDMNHLQRIINVENGNSFRDVAARPVAAADLYQDLAERIRVHEAYGDFVATQPAELQQTLRLLEFEQIHEADVRPDFNELNEGLEDPDKAADRLIKSWTGDEVRTGLREGAFIPEKGVLVESIKRFNDFVTSGKAGADVASQNRMAAGNAGKDAGGKAAAVGYSPPAAPAAKPETTAAPPPQATATKSEAAAQESAESESSLLTGNGVVVPRVEVSSPRVAVEGSGIAGCDEDDEEEEEEPKPEQPRA